MPRLRNQDGIEKGISRLRLKLPTSISISAPIYSHRPYKRVCSYIGFPSSAPSPSRPFRLAHPSSPSAPSPLSLAPRLPPVSAAAFSAPPSLEGEGCTCAGLDQSAPGHTDAARATRARGDHDGKPLRAGRVCAYPPRRKPHLNVFGNPVKDSPSPAFLAREEWGGLGGGRAGGFHGRRDTDHKRSVG